MLMENETSLLPRMFADVQFLFLVGKALTYYLFDVFHIGKGLGVHAVNNLTRLHKLTAVDYAHDHFLFLLGIAAHNPDCSYAVLDFGNQRFL